MYYMYTIHNFTLCSSLHIKKYAQYVNVKLNTCCYCNEIKSISITISINVNRIYHGNDQFVYISLLCKDTVTKIMK